MSTSYFAHYAYGVLLPEDLADKLTKRLDEISAADEPDDEDDAVEENRAYTALTRLSEAEIESYLAAVNAPPGASLIWTGDEDDRPGSCNIDSERWIVGWGVYAFPDATAQVTPQFDQEAQWYSWVTAG